MKYTLFLEYRPDIFFDDSRVFIRVTHVNTIDEATNALFEERIDNEHPDMLSVNDHILASEALEVIKNAVPLYCQDGDSFFILAHNKNHDHHRPLDFDQVRELIDQLGCAPENLTIVECIFDDDLVSCKTNPQGFAAYFAEFL